MNVASLELCRELYELSGWDDTFHAYWETSSNWLISSRDEEGAIRDVPAYDLGYLLRKLPVGNYVAKYKKHFTATVYGRHMKGIGIQHSDTPENAACALAIELLKLGELPPSQKPNGELGKL